MENFKKYLTIRNFILVICVVVFCCSGGYLLNKYVSEKKAQETFESLTSFDTEIQNTTDEQDATEVEEEEETIFSYLGVKNPGKVIDWEYLWSVNDDIYAWIYVPNTKIDYPILQHPTNDTYYLEYNLNGSKGYPGCIYTEMVNEKNFSDHNTVIYGHNMKNGTMFRDVHKFTEGDFFEENRYVFIYTPEEVLAYEIYATYRFTNAHILYNYDCFSENGFSSYLQMVQDDYGRSGNFRDVEVTGDDHIITLSTCITGQDDKRLLLQAVLVEYDGPDASADVSMETTEAEE